ncbi:protein kinase [Egicoccus sp. AB-alg6-2]|uniref:protein kinase domain-containing protein n=1 Tax=Egicoccus sp. AB-alg6-2 TaxID=3242692 RepID=UPI00359D8356
MTPTSPPLRVGGRYELVRRIARGGGGTVWEANDEVLDRVVAVKQVEIPDELSDDERDRLRRRVMAEARAAARLEHPAVVVVHDVLDGDDVVNLVMEHVGAPTLREVVQQRGPLPETAAAAIGYGLLDVLTEAHRRGVVHRDVKPSNVFVLDDGSVKLGDFGIAALAGEVSLTRTGVALGSPSYLAPEQARGESAAPPADLWGLGATLYYAVEGAPPFDRRTALATVHAVVNEPMRPFQHADALREPLTALLDKDPSARPDPARVLALLAAVAGIPASALPPAAEPTATSAPVTAPLPSPLPAAEPASAPGAPSDDEDEVVRASEPGHGVGRRAWQWLVPAALLLVFAVVAFATLGGGTDGAEDEPPLADRPDGTSDPTEQDSAPTDGPAAPEQDEQPEADEDATGTDDAPVSDDPGESVDVTAEPTEPDEAPDGGDGAAAPTGGYVIPESSPPGDWQVVEGPTYRVAVPAGWQERAASGNRTDWVEPGTGAYLRMDWTDAPASDPLADWEQAEAGFAQRQSDYQRVRLEPATYRNWEAAMWEYTYTSGGAALHAINLNVLADDLGHAYALNLQAPAGEWDRIADQFPAIAGSFEPTVGG